jgi:hypothetical protein
MIRWRAGNLASRRAAGNWIRSQVRPGDNERPMVVQSVPEYEDDSFNGAIQPGTPVPLASQLDTAIATVWQ